MNWTQMKSYIEPYLPEIMTDMEFLLRIFVAMILGLLIGNERKNRNKAAGMRTHAMVALGSALMMVVSKYGFGDAVQGDGARLAAQVVSGVGFLGAGMIFVRNNMVNGLTTAAGIWTTAGIGLTVGAGMYTVGILSTVMMIIMQNVLHRYTVFSNTAVSGLIRMTIVNRPGAIEDLERILTSHGIDIQSVQINKTEKDKIKLEFDVIYPRKLDKPTLFCMLAERSDIISVGE